jgi:hypothetical protein
MSHRQCESGAFSLKHACLVPHKQQITRHHRLEWISVLSLGRDFSAEYGCMILKVASLSSTLAHPAWCWEMRVLANTLGELNASSRVAKEIGFS